MRISLLANIALHVSATTMEPNPLVESECTCPTADPASVTAVNEFLTSADYKQFAASQLLSEDNFRVVISRVPSLKLPPATDAQVEAALEGRKADENDLSIVSSSPIPRGDFIAVHGIRELRAVAEQLGGEMPSESVIQNLVILSSKTDTLSKCDSLTCNIWRSILRQVAIQSLIGAPAQGDFQRIIDGLAAFHVESGSEIAPTEEAFVEPFSTLMIISCVAQCLCYCGKACVEWYCTTTTPAPITTTLTPINVLKFSEFPIVNTMLEEAAEIVRGVTSSADAPTKQTIAEAVAKMNGILHKIPATIYDWPKGNGKAMFAITSGIQQAIYVSLDKDPETWPVTARQLLDLIEQIRTDVALFGVVSA